MLITLLVDIWWLHRFRAGYPLDIDESRYLAFGLSLRDGLAGGGPAGLWHVWRAQHDFGPLLGLASVPVFLVGGRSVMAGLAAQLLFVALLLISGWGLGRRLGGRTGGVLAAALVAGMPAVIDFSRSLQLAVTAAAAMAGAMWALLASERLARRRWVVAWGILLGLLPLARTMAIAFVPGVVLAALWLAWPGPSRRARLVNLGLGLGVGAAVAASWLATSWHAVFDYLTNFGYGAQSAHFASSGSRLGLGYWTRELGHAVREDLLLPLTVLIAVALALGGGALWVRGRAGGGVRRTLATGRGREAVSVLIVLAWGYLVVSSSRNEGVGFRVPLLALLAALAGGAVCCLPWRRVRLALAVACVGVAAVNVLAKADVIGWLSQERSARLPLAGTVAVLSGRGYIQGYVLGSLETPPGPPTRPLPGSQRGWSGAYRTLSAVIVEAARRAHVAPVVDLATDEPLLNANDLVLAARLRYRLDLAVSLLPGLPAPAGAGAYAEVLSARAEHPAFLVTVSRVALSYFTLQGLSDPDQGLLERGAAVLGWRCLAAVGLPDGRVAVVSGRARPGAGAGAGAPAATCRPRVLRTVPADRAAAAPARAPVAVLFDRPMDPDPTARAFALVDVRSGRRVAGRVAWLGELALVFRPRVPLKAGRTYRVSVGPGAGAEIGSRLGGARRWTFRVA